MVNDAGEQAIEFFMKRAQLAEDTADHHFRDGEFSKGAALYKQAYGFFLKAKANRPDDKGLDAILSEVKQKYQDAVKKAQKEG